VGAFQVIKTQRPTHPPLERNFGETKLDVVSRNATFPQNIFHVNQGSLQRVTEAPTFRRDGTVQPWKTSDSCTGNIVRFVLSTFTQQKDLSWDSVTY
jgi:hypothetical protein